MATNQKPFLLLNPHIGWDALVPPNGIEAGAQLRLQPMPGDGRPLSDSKGDFGGLSLPSAMAVDRHGRIYVLDGERIWRYEDCDGYFEKLAGIGGRGCQPRQFDRPRGLVISLDNDLYVADSGNRRVQVFALKGLPLRAVWGPYLVIPSGEGYRLELTSAVKPDPCEEGTASERVFPEGTWHPWDIAVTPDRWAFVSDYANGLIHVFDPHGKWRQAWDGQDDEGVGLERPTHLAIDCEGNLYLVQEGQEAVVVLDRKGQFVRRVRFSIEVEGKFQPGPIGFAPDGRLYLTDAYTGCVYIYDGSQRAAHPCTHFKGHGCAIAFDEEGRPLLADKLEGLIYRLENEVAYVPEGTFLAGPLDSERYRCQWHRVLLDGRIEPGTLIQVETFTSDSAKQTAQIISLPEERWATEQIWSQVEDGEWDCLVRSQPGRYLWLRLTLYGDQRHTPEVRSVRLEYPRQSSLRFLPGVYQEDPTSAEFLDRFLSITDTIFGEIGDTITRMERYFDPAATPATPKGAGEIDFLTWLASWIGLALEAGWPEERRRQLVAHAHRLYALRGTPEGLRLHIALYTGIEPKILEHYKLRRWLFLNQARLGDSAVLWGEDVVNRLQLDDHAQIGDFQLRDTGDPYRDPFHVHAHQFTVYIPRKKSDEAEERTLQRIVELAKPAHTQGEIRIAEPRMRVGVQSIVGVNTIIGQYPSGVVTGEGALGYDTVLSPSDDEGEPPQIRIGTRSRIGSNTLIN